MVDEHRRMHTGDPPAVDDERYGSIVGHEIGIEERGLAEAAVARTA